MVLRSSTRRSTALAARAGFTLMELLVVVAILVVLVSVATPMYFSYLEKSRMKTAKANAAMLASVLKNYQVEHGTLPTEGDWSQLPLDRVPMDPWGKPFVWIASMTVLGDGTQMPIPIVFSTGPAGNLGPDGPCSSSSAAGGS